MKTHVKDAALIFSLFVWTSQAVEFSSPKTMVVVDDVVDVRSMPKPHNKKYEYDPLQETQLEKGEPVLVFEREGKWARVECSEQVEFTHNSRWQGYPGWVLFKSLTADVTKRLKISPPIDLDDNLRQQILSSAEKHLGSPYLWGGRSLYDPTYKKALTGVDCSGLVNWSYRSNGWLIPRDAHEQFLKAKRISPNELKPADLIFLARIDKPDKVVHVMIYKGNGEIIEAPQSGEAVRQMSFQQRFGRSMEGLKNGDLLQDRVMYTGTFFEEE